MDKNLASIEVECECGEIHTLVPLAVVYNSFEKLVEMLKAKNVINLRIFLDDKLTSHYIYSELLKILEDSQINYNVTILSVKHAEIFKASSILSNGEDYIIAFGEYSLIELIKYYACSITVDYSIILYNSFFDFTFSKFARVYDGISYDFYRVEAPNMVIIWECLLKDFEIHKYKQYLKSKSIAYFENVLALRINEKAMCEKINSKVFKVKNKARILSSPKDIINSMIYLGRAMSLFNQTKAFFGADLDVANTLEVLTKQPFLEMYLLSSKACFELYNKALETKLKILELNINKRIDKVKNCLNLSITKVLRIIKTRKQLDELNKSSRLISALKYMLMNLLESEDYDVALVNEKSLSSAIYMAPEFSSRYNFLNFIRDLGYLENLI